MSSTIRDTQKRTTKDGLPNLASVDVIVAHLHHPADARQRIRAISAFVKRLRRHELFQPTWTAAGGAAGVAALMSGFSVYEVHRLCRQLGRTASAANAQAERRDGLGELVEILFSGDADPRPLEHLYQFIVPACHESVIRKWNASTTAWTRMQRRRMFLGHPLYCQQRFLDEAFSVGGDSIDERDRFLRHQTLFRGNTQFCERVLIKLESLDSDKICIPGDFFSEFAMPLLRRLANPRSSGSKDDLHKCLGLVVRCCRKHAGHMRARLQRRSPGGLVQFVTQQWIDDSSKDRGILEENLRSLYEIMGPDPDVDPRRLHSLIQEPKRQNATSRYELLCILVRYLPKDGFDLEEDTPEANRKLKAISPEPLGASYATWPVETFMSLPPGKSLDLFLRLRLLYPAEGFVARSLKASTILNQEQTPKLRSGDPDIIEAILRRRAQPQDESWLPTARRTIQARIKTATESREAEDRGFWIKSAINLCVAVGELNMLADSLRLARRFTADSGTGPKVWGLQYLKTDEFLQLLTVVPEVTGTETTTAQLIENLVSKADRYMASAHNVVLTVLQNAVDAVGGPGFDANKWTLVVELPGLLSRRRAVAIQAIQKRAKEISSPGMSSEMDIDTAIVNAVWRPTIEQLLEVEASMAGPAAPKTWSAQWQQAPKDPLGLLLRDLPARSPSLLAGTTRYCLETLRARLPPALARRHMASIAEMTIRLANSSQPALALPFIQTLVQNSEYSVDHRHLLTNKLLSSLPPDTARSFLQTMIGVVTEKMERHNNQVEDGDDKSVRRTGDVAVPGLKVTTIKMMAQRLNGTTAVGNATSSEMLVSLLKEARHVDARVEIVRSLLGALQGRTATPSLRAMILDILKEHVLPMASQLHERRPTTEADWQCEDGEMPEISESNALFDVLLGGLKSKLLRSEDHAELGAVVVATLELSAKNNRRWMSRFVEKHGFDSNMIEDVPVAPARMQELRSALQQEWDVYPDGLITMLQELTLVKIQPPASLVRVTQHVKANSTLRASHEGNHWLWQYDNPGSRAYDLGLDRVMATLSEMPISQGESEKAWQIRRVMLAVADRCIRGGHPDTIYDLVKKIADCPSRQEYAQMNWNTHASPIMRQVISIVESCYSEGPTSVRLPDMVRLRLAMMKLSTWDGALRSREVRQPTARAFAEQVSRLVELIVSRSHRPYHNDFTLLKRQLTDQGQLTDRRLPDTAGDLPACLHIAVALGRLHNDVLVVREERREGDAENSTKSPPLAAYLCLELAADALLDCARDPKDAEVIRDVRELLGDWRESADSLVKDTGTRLEEILRHRSWWSS